MASRIPTGLRELLDEKFAAHESRSNLAISELEGRLRDNAYDEVKASAIRHSETLALIASQHSVIDAHDVRIARVEVLAEKADAAKAANFSQWRAWALGLLAAVLVTAFSSFAALLRR